MRTCVRIDIRVYAKYAHIKCVCIVRIYLSCTEGEVVYWNILRHLRIGRCDNETFESILNLEREIGDLDDAIHLYFTNLLVDAHNVFSLNLLPGDRTSFTATDTGNL